MNTKYIIISAVCFSVLSVYTFISITTLYFRIEKLEIIIQNQKESIEEIKKSSNQIENSNNNSKSKTYPQQEDKIIHAVVIKKTGMYSNVSGASIGSNESGVGRPSGLVSFLEQGNKVILIRYGLGKYWRVSNGKYQGWVNIDDLNVLK
jgi:hypothetical protein